MHNIFSFILFYSVIYDPFCFIFILTIIHNSLILSCPKNFFHFRRK